MPGPTYPGARRGPPQPPPTSAAPVELTTQNTENRSGPDLGGCAARLKLVQDSGSLLRVLFWRYLPVGEQLIDSRKSLLHGLH